MFSKRFLLLSIYLFISSHLNEFVDSSIIVSENDSSVSSSLKTGKIIRKRRGLLDLSLDVEPVLNLLTNKGKDTTTTVAPIRAPSRPNAINHITNVPRCGRRVVTHTELITGGQPTKPGDWPWHAALYRLKTTGSNQQYICGGSLLSRTRVLTAGHCVVENTEVILPERLFVTLGKHNLAGGDMASQEKSVFDIMIHPDFSRSTLSNDIAILKLSSRVTYTDYVQPVCLWDIPDPNKMNIFNRHGTVVGWGFTEHDAPSSQLTKAVMPVAPDVDCIKTNPSFYAKFITDKTFCAGYRNDTRHQRLIDGTTTLFVTALQQKKNEDVASIKAIAGETEFHEILREFPEITKPAGTSVCNGDSGGGMVFPERGPDGEDTWYVRGIVSLSAARKDKNICDPNEYTIFTDVAQYSDFIKENV